MARPKKAASKVKSTYFRFRLTEDEKKIIDAAALSRSLDSSAWARSELIALAKKLSNVSRGAAKG